MSSSTNVRSQNLTQVAQCLHARIYIRHASSLALHLQQLHRGRHFITRSYFSPVRKQVLVVSLRIQNFTGLDI